MGKYTEIIDLVNDLEQGSTAKYSKDQTNEMLRAGINEILGCEDGKYSPKQFRRNKVALFEFLEEVLDQRIEDDIREQFEQFVEYRNVALGDSIEFIVPQDELFQVSEVSPGNNAIRRQRLEGQKSFRIAADVFAIKVYEELDRFLAGRTDWVNMMDRIERSFRAHLITKIATAVKAAYSGLDAPYYVTGSFDLDDFNDLVEHVRAASGTRDVVVMGVEKALRRAVPAFVETGGLDLSERNARGFFPVVDGVTMVPLPQGHIPGTNTFAIDENFLLVVPNGNEKIIKIVTEGETEIKETNGMTNADESQEIFVRKRMGIGAVTNAKYGVYILS